MFEVDSLGVVTFSYFCSMFKRMRANIPANFKFYLRSIALAMCLLSFTRVVFYVGHSGNFAQVGFGEWLAGAWFDLMTLALVLFPFVFVASIPWSNNEPKKILKWTLWLTYYLPFSIVIAFNLLDVAYFSFTQKRSTADLFAIVSAGNDVNQLLGSFIKDYWLLILLFVFLLVGIAWCLKRLKKGIKATPFVWQRHLVWTLILVSLHILVGRGGIQLKPASAVDANKYTSPQNTALVLNSGFTILKSIGKDNLEQKHYFSEKQVNQLFRPIHKSQPQKVLPGKPNVMIIMLESFGNEWVGKMNGQESYTPFLDQFLDSCWYFEYGFANGKKSIEAVPTILASLPTLMDNPFISSGYSSNQIEGLPAILKKQGYSSAFYHGATNGSMRFDAFAKQLGFEQYIGRTEYGNEAHSDKTWGILDEYFNPWTAKQLSKLKQPFCGTLFTLSSHHPYYVPPQWRKKLKKGPYPICMSLAYGDMSLKKFFDQARKEPWFKNTLFVLVADHTNATSNSAYANRTQVFRIPIAFYDPTGKLPRKKEAAIFQQMDILPTVLDLLNVETSYYAFGHSFFSKEPREAVAYLEGSYFIAQGKYQLVFSNDEVKDLYDITKVVKEPKSILKQHPKEAKALEKRLRAIIQVYNRDLLSNQLMPK